MSKAWHLKTGEIATLTFDYPDREVNVLDSDILKEFEEHIDRLSGEKQIKAVLIASAKKNIFIAGADINEIDSIHTREDAVKKAQAGKDIFQKLEDLPFPTIAVINGACLGGGLELALACTYRVATFSPKVKIGLPEVNLGILPGFGGSIRLPILIGLLKALPMILGGKIIDGKGALRAGIVDDLFPEARLLDAAGEFAGNIIDGSFKRKPHKKSLLENNPLGRFLVYKRARADIAKRAKGFYPAPYKALDVVKNAYKRPRRAASRIESEGFADLALTDVSKNLISLFFLSEKYKKYRWIESKIDSIKPEFKCAVIGAGIMGGGIAQLVSSRDIPVRVRDIQPEALSGALREASRIYNGAIKRRRLKKYQKDFKMGLISVGLDSGGMASSSIVIEAVVEDMGIKQKVFAELGTLTSESTVLASNTSSLSIDTIAADCRYPERTIGLHFFNPVDRMPLVEVIRSSKTSEMTLERTVRFARRLGKTVIVVKDAPGFLVNRLLLPYINEAVYLLEEGMDPEHIDRIATSFGMPMGPLELADQVGIDVGYKVAHILYEGFGPRMQVCHLLQGIKDQGLLGRKSGEGVYLYKNGRKGAVNPKIKAMVKRKKIPSDREALGRMIYIMINESARCLEENVVNEPGSVDIGMIMGTGFPPFRGGLLRFADSVGTKPITEALQNFQQSTGSERFEISAYLQTLAKENKAFYSE